jgi:endonuclease/exonuclease/phosphatase (EEP) superfamily protein YafD
MRFGFLSSSLRLAVIAGVAAGLAFTILAWLAHWWGALDVINNGLPGVTAGAVVLLCLAAITRDWRLIVPAALIAAINIALVIAASQGTAAEAAPGSQRFLRVATFNLWRGNERMDDVAKFLAEADANVVVLQEVTRDHGSKLRQALGPRYPYSLGETGLVILSKHAIIAEGRVDRPGYPPWISLMLRWARLDVNGTIFELAGVHLTRPFYPELQQQDIAVLTQFVQSRTVPLIVAGDFNMSPWTQKLERFTETTGLKRYNTVDLTWPMRWRGVPLLPLVAIDNVFASQHFAAIATKGGPRLGSDHRPIIADIALAPPLPEATK